ncbi:hypothetical protein AB0M48_32595 [Lentzea sp. NPDC051208]|uniref:hypothetical protein n=1 Tax=Lentzea sp. NPDC051208 TaxID=3154642 RepID=UPI003428E45B
MSPSASRGRPLGSGLRAAWRTAGLLWAGLALVAYWWVAGGGITDLGEWESGRSCWDCAATLLCTPPWCLPRLSGSVRSSRTCS